jgi:hypothetical protein
MYLTDVGQKFVAADMTQASVQKTLLIASPVRLSAFNDGNVAKTFTV